MKEQVEKKHGYFGKFAEVRNQSHETYEALL